MSWKHRICMFGTAQPSPAKTTPQKEKGSQNAFQPSRRNSTLAACLDGIMHCYLGILIKSSPPKAGGTQVTDFTKGKNIRIFTKFLRRRSGGCQGDPGPLMFLFVVFFCFFVCLFLFFVFAFFVVFVFFCFFCFCVFFSFEDFYWKVAFAAQPSHNSACRVAICDLRLVFFCRPQRRIVLVQL